MLNFISFQHFNCESNEVAHKMAQIGFKFLSPQFWVKDVHEEVRELVEQD